MIAGEIPCQQPDADPNDWFVVSGSPTARRAKTLCMACPLYWDCQELAINEGIPYGIFGGMDERDRGRIWKSMGGKPTHFQDSLDAALGPLLQGRRDHENFDYEKPGDAA